ncbi:aldolase [Paenibacillus qinlingensis]|uniref:aldolase n=1 Tax=Paenibacillus qinlingensis TaxID=1837343 RepID=UPI00156437C8|nr:aldolase [Paenibacillus qinlingensis]NQX60371.1 aldolase [Paenibacillus qinlingensis]
MIKTQERVIFQAFGLSIRSDLHLPELSLLSEIQGDADVEVTIADLSRLWSELVPANQNILLHEDKVIFRIHDTAIFLIQDGNRITISPVNHAEESKIRLYLLGTCMGVILMQKRILPLHGSAIAIDGKAYAIVGHSGAGKSTLASAFINHGYSLLSDDVIPITFDSSNKPMVTPAYPQQKLWQESLTHFGMESSQYTPIFQRETKYTIPVPANFTTETLPLAAVFELVKYDGEQISIQQIPRLAGLSKLFHHTYRQSFLAPLGLMDWHFTTSARMVEHMDIYQLNRPTNGFTAHQLVSLVLDTIH